jgi:hypothetical protein
MFGNSNNKDLNKMFLLRNMLSDNLGGGGGRANKKILFIEKVFN